MVHNGVFGYVRTSSSKQESSIYTQVCTITSYCIDNGIKLQGIYIDQARTATKNLHLRTSFETLRYNLGGFHNPLVLVTYPDRLSRGGNEVELLQGSNPTVTITYVRDGK